MFFATISGAIDLNSGGYDEIYSKIDTKYIYVMNNDNIFSHCSMDHLLGDNSFLGII
jgi:hypothetical protein